jgi:hypothetical protein
MPEPSLIQHLSDPQEQQVPVDGLADIVLRPERQAPSLVLHVLPDCNEDYGVPNPTGRATLSLFPCLLE